jgi:hypothetical protein
LSGSQRFRRSRATKFSAGLKVWTGTVHSPLVGVGPRLTFIGSPGCGRPPGGGPCGAVRRSSALLNSMTCWLLLRHRYRRSINVALLMSQHRCRVIFAGRSGGRHRRSLGWPAFHRVDLRVHGSGRRGGKTVPGRMRTPPSGRIGGVSRVRVIVIGPHRANRDLTSMSSPVT